VRRWLARQPYSVRVIKKRQKHAARQEVSRDCRTAGYELYLYQGTHVHHAASQGVVDMRRTPEQQKAAAEQKIAALKQRIARIEKVETAKASRARNHRLIVLGTLVEQHALDDPHSLSAQTLIHDIEAHLAEHPTDADNFAELCARLSDSEVAASDN